MGEWIEHDGRSYPLPKGVKVDVIRNNGEFETIVTGTIFGTNIVYNTTPNSSDNTWLWASPRFVFDKSVGIIAYRLHDDGAEATRRSERSANFRRMADDALKGDKPVRAPQKERA